MADFLTDYYLWIKSLHLISVIAWMSGMFYLPRLFVYHTQTEVGSAGSERFKIMERKLMRVIINPAMVGTWIFGLCLVFTPGIIDWSADIWAWVKAAAVLAMSGLHGANSRWRKAFERDENEKSEKFFRAANEIPTLLMMVIVIMVIVKPF